MRRIISLISVLLTFYSYSEIEGQPSDVIKYLNSDSTVMLCSDSIDSHMVWYDHTELGLKIKFHRGRETSLKFPVDTSKWVFSESKYFGVRFKHPQELIINLIKTDNINAELDSDSTIQLGYSVTIYSSKKTFEEIAQSESFLKESEKDSGQVITDVPIPNEKWVILGKSQDPAEFLDCREWSGLRGNTWRGGGSMGLLPWGATFLRSKSDVDSHLVITYYRDPFSGRPKEQMISENEFYQIVSSLEFIN
jgi:hypothetical protein